MLMLNLNYLWHFSSEHINVRNNMVGLVLIYENVKYMVYVLYNFSLYCYVYIIHSNDQIKEVGMHNLLNHYG